METRRASRRRFLGGLLAGGLALLAVQPLAAHAAFGHTPYIQVNDGDWGPINPHVRVQGAYFPAGDRILVEATTATGMVAVRQVAAVPVLTRLAATPGVFATTLTVGYGYRGQLLHAFAVDLTRGLRSNTVFFRLPWLPIPKCQPYTCQ